MATVLDRKKGSVKWFDGQKGFGFIMPGDGGDDVFVHRSSVKAIGFISLAKGENVEFSIEVREDGRRSAVNVTGPCGAYLHGPCFSCGEFGHLARDCVLSNGGCRGVGPCFSCGGMGHLFRQCPARLKCFELPSPSPCPCERCSHDSQLSQTICGTSLPDFSLEEDFRINAPGEWRQCWESIGLVEEEEQDSEEDAEEEFSIGDDEEERQSIFGEQRNWAELPRDVLSLIFKKIAAIEILTSAQFVCRTWQQLSHEPEIWRCIDMTDVEPDWTHDMKSVAVEAVDRSKGCLEEFYLGYFGDDELMLYIADRTTVLRCLRLMSVPHISEEGLAEALGRCHMFNELEISLCFFEDVVVELVGKACPRLKSFSLNAQPYRFADNSGYDSDWNQDEAALAIAKHMQQLTRLQLIGNPLTDDGLHAILDNCRCLEYLDIRRCLYVNLDENLNRKCARIKVLRLPDDSVADFHMDVTIGGLESPPEDYDSDIGFFGFENDLYSVMSYEDYFDDFWF